MYIPAPEQLVDFDLANANQFVRFWSSFYEDNWEQSHYFEQLNETADLTSENVRRLLNWKDRRFLAQRSSGEANPRVEKVITNLESLNRFRRGEISEQDLWALTGKIYPEGFVWNAFLLHIAQPHSHPIIDQNVLRSWSAHTKGVNNQGWGTYKGYCDYLAKIADTMGVARMPDKTRHLKQIDNAPFEFGRFLERYLPKAQSTTAAQNHT